MKLFKLLENDQPVGLSEVTYSLRTFLSIDLKRSFKNSFIKCLDYTKKIAVLDKEVIEYLNEKDIVSISQLQQLNKEQREEAIHKMKK